MPVTNYYCVDGQMLGESTNGVFTGYLPDANGSVTATVDDAGQVLNTYRYKPFGGLLAKTGNAPDPRFGWRGFDRQSGAIMFRPTGTHRGYYSSQAAYVQPGGPRGTYMMKNPILGAENCVVECLELSTAKLIGPCGEFGLVTIWGLNNSCKNFDGYVIQEITLTSCMTTCDGRPMSLAETCCPQNVTHDGTCKRDRYWEGWRIVIEDGEWQTDPSLMRDFFKNQPHNCTIGSYEIHAEAGLVEKKTIFEDEDWQNGKVPCAGQLVSTCNKPAWWPLPNMKSRSHFLQWACCCDGKHDLTKDCPVGPYQDTLHVPQSDCVSK
jgi:hypothetical protein